METSFRRLEFRPLSDSCRVLVQDESDNTTILPAGQKANAVAERNFEKPLLQSVALS
jgi:hypothetical protein